MTLTLSGKLPLSNDAIKAAAKALKCANPRAAVMAALRADTPERPMELAGADGDAHPVPGGVVWVHGRPGDGPLTTAAALAQSALRRGRRVFWTGPSFLDNGQDVFSPQCHIKMAQPEDLLLTVPELDTDEQRARAVQDMNTIQGEWDGRAAHLVSGFRGKDLSGSHSGMAAFAVAITYFSLLRDPAEAILFLDRQALGVPGDALERQLHHFRSQQNRSIVVIDRFAPNGLHLNNGAPQDTRITLMEGSAVQTRGTYTQVGRDTLPFMAKAHSNPQRELIGHDPGVEAAVEYLERQPVPGTHTGRLEAVSRAFGYRSWHAAQGRRE